MKRLVISLACWLAWSPFMPAETVVTNRPAQWTVPINEPGVPELREHLSNVTMLMRASTSWLQFIELLDRARPRVGDTLKLPLDFADDKPEI